MNQIFEDCAGNCYPRVEFAAEEFLSEYSRLRTCSLALTQSLPPGSDSRRKEREAHYRSETLKKLAEAQGAGASSAVELVKEEERIALRRRLEGQRLGGLITVAVGIGLMVLLKAVDQNHHTFLVGVIPLLVGAALLAYSYVLGSKN